MENNIYATLEKQHLTDRNKEENLSQYYSNKDASNGIFII